MSFRITFLLFFISFITNAQQLSKLEGMVVDENNIPLAGVNVYLKNTSYGTQTNLAGVYSFNMPNGEYNLIVSYIGFKAVSQKINVTNSQKINFTLNEEAYTLDDVVVLGKTNAQVIREEAYAVEVVETKSFKNLSTNANDILGRISGVNIRQSGGVGSDFSLSLNGLSGNQVRIFLDGVPMDYFGSSLTLNNFSANLIERIEVYKGVVPIHLSSDALGGAINVITNQQTESFLDISYGLGSFGTNIASLNTQYRADSGFTVKLKSFYNTSQNNYKVPVQLVNFETGRENDFATEVEHFHDAYNSKMVWLETGFTSTKFADKLLVGAMYSDNYSEVQQPANAIGEAKIPYGEVTTEEEKFITNFSYAKNGLFTDNLSLNAYFVGVFSENRNRDISDYRYDWFGNRTLSSDTSTGEIENRKTFLKLDSDNYLGNLNGEYELAENHSIAANYSVNYLTIKGSDEFKAQNNTQFNNPNTVNKQVIGLAYTNAFFEKKLKNTLFAKSYDYKINSLETNYQGIETNLFEVNRQNFGFGISSTFAFKKLQTKVSFENAIRFPEAIELFGDGLNFVPSPSLLPEDSKNYNLGFIYRGKFLKNEMVLSMNGFIRDAKNFILPQVQGIKIFHINNGRVLSKGVDFASSYARKNNFFFALNGTYLDLRDNNEFDTNGSGNLNSLYKDRVPNVPYLFGNVSVSYRKENLFKQNDNASISINENYVHPFFYRWESLGSEDKALVPQQLTTGLEFVYSMANEKYNASFGVTNLWNADVYDNFQQLRPGRTFNLKLRYFIN